MAESGRVPQEVLDGLGKELESLNGAQMMQPEEPEEPETPEEPEEPEAGEPESESEGDLPDGYKTLEEYVADGGDPDYYKGPKAYKQQREIISELKDIKEKNRQRDEEMAALTKHFEKERSRLIKQIEDEQAKAKEDLDFDRYEELGKQRSELEQENPHAQAEIQEHPVIAGFRGENPELNPASPKFDKVYTSAFQGAFNALIEDTAQRAGRSLTDAEIKDCLTEIKQRISPQQQQPRRQPKGVEGTRKKTSKPDPVASLDPATKRLYERWSKSPKKHLQESAKKLLNAGGQ